MVLMADPDISEFLPPARVLECKTARHVKALATADPDKHARLVAALADSRATDQRIATVLTDWGYRVSDSVVRTHRREECCCAK